MAGKTPNHFPNPNMGWLQQQQLKHIPSLSSNWLLQQCTCNHPGQRIWQFCGSIRPSLSTQWLDQIIVNAPTPSRTHTQVVEIEGVSSRIIMQQLYIWQTQFCIQGFNRVQNYPSSTKLVNCRHQLISWLIYLLIIIPPIKSPSPYVKHYLLLAKTRPLEHQQGL